MSPIADGAPHHALSGHLLGFADAIGLGRFALAGSSLGAHVALLVCLKRPEAVESLTVFGSATSFASEEQVLETLENHRRASLSQPDQRGVDAAREALLSYVAAHEVEDQDVIVHALPAAAARRDVVQDRERLFTALSTTGAVQGSRVAERLDAVKAATDVIWGIDDPVSPVQLADGAVRHGRLTKVEACGHLPYLEHPDLVAGLMTTSQTERVDVPS